MKFLKSISTFLLLLWNFPRIVKLRRYENSLKQAVTNQEVDKIIAKDIIVKDIRKALRIDAHSNYIPDDIKNRAEIKMMVELRHREVMQLLNIRITDDLKLV